MVDLLAEAVDIDLDEIGFAVEMAVPDVFDDFAARDGVRRAQKEKFEKCEFFGGERDFISGAGDRAAMAVEFKIGAAQFGFATGEAKLRCADLELDRHRRSVTRAGNKIPLTSKEFALLELLLLRSPDSVTRSEIIEHVWDSHFDSETNLVEVYINRLRQKIDHPPAAKLLHTL